MTILQTNKTMNISKSRQKGHSYHAKRRWSPPNKYAGEFSFVSATTASACALHDLWSLLPFTRVYVGAVTWTKRLKAQMQSNGINGCVWNYGTQMYPGYPKISWLIIIDHQLQLTFLGHPRSPCQGAGTQWGVVLPAKWWPDCLALPVASPNLQHMFFQNSWNEKHTLEREIYIYIFVYTTVCVSTFSL